jgi:dipeptidyl aminopeptidase/acylaminoacyl peptidase
MVLIYPVITMQEKYTHKGSKLALLKSNPDKDLVDYFSSELQVTADTPSTFIIHSTDDPAVPVENSLLFYQALKKAGVNSEMHIFPTGGHGYSLALNDDHLGAWPDLLIKWLKSSKE